MQDLVGSHLLLNKDGCSKIVPQEEKALPKRYTCDVCDFASLHLAALKRHKQNLHGFNLELYRCTVCNYGTKYKSSLKLYFVYFRCTVCNYGTKYKSSLKRHMDYQHDKDNQKVNKCTLCDYTSSYTSTVERHLQTVHHRAREFFCSHCDYSTVHKFSLDRHVRLLHQLEKSFLCDFCDFSTHRKSFLKLHISTSHHDKKAHKCSVCGFETLYRTALVRHASTTGCGTAGLHPPPQQQPPIPSSQESGASPGMQTVFKEEPVSDYAEIITVPISLTSLPHQSVEESQELYLTSAEQEPAVNGAATQQDIYNALAALSPTTSLQISATSSSSTPSPSIASPGKFSAQVPVPGDDTESTSSSPSAAAPAGQVLVTSSLPSSHVTEHTIVNNMQQEVLPGTESSAVLASNTSNVLTSFFLRNNSVDNMSLHRQEPGGPGALATVIGGGDGMLMQEARDMMKAAGDDSILAADGVGSTQLSSTSMVDGSLTVAKIGAAAETMMVTGTLLQLRHQDVGNLTGALQMTGTLSDTVTGS